jgi:hypothetical protein
VRELIERSEANLEEILSKVQLKPSQSFLITEQQRKAFEKVKMYHGLLGVARSVHVIQWTPQTHAPYLSALQVYVAVLSVLKATSVFDQPELFNAVQAELDLSLK